MEFKIQKKGNENVHKYPSEDMALARDFIEALKKEVEDFFMVGAVFGSVSRNQSVEHSDIDVLVVTDDVSYVMTEELVEGYRIIVDNLIRRVSLKLHVTSMTFTSFWEHVKAGDPVVVNILRDGVALHDHGCFEPLQKLLHQGRIRPSEESIWRYYGRSPRTLLNSRWHTLQATLDLYWAVIDAAHAALMRAHQVPPTPEHVADLLDKVYVKHKKLEKKYVDSMHRFYKLSKMITHREIKHISGKEYDTYFKEAEAFIKRMRTLIEKRV